ncbi:alkaline phosphatase family protein [Brevibacillus sp. SYP-B805]|uniref:alkaline phosphatase family protein n=1 Tax=Brevibacillus sp. SYP-B805 TaxID=1578199 RepID=UPI0013EBBC26|nr:alkaline phosphatase family protein [Brevibacillus sp. SYP-B805]NGQ94091.1 alkaline phosphatase family protein [Brevibacillus sp. SYP-B805]
MKKIILFLVDSMMPDVLEKCVAEKKAPALQFFLEHGELIPDCVTVFPTMTASVDCSLLSGVYPDQHKVPGLVWYDPKTKRIINYVNGFQPVYRIGIGQCASNVLFDLNERHFSRNVKTIHEELEEKGLVSGSINVIAHRGHKQHDAKIPFVLDAITGFQLKEKVSGPTILSLGTLIQPDIFRPINWNWSHAFASSYGINDSYAIDVLIEVIRSGKQPDFTLVYLPDNDHKVHQTPELAVEHLADVDKQLVRFLDSFASWEQAVERNVIMLISDHGQTVIGQEPEANIPLDEMLFPFRVHRLGADITPDWDVVVCNNERMSYLYPLSAELLPKVVEAVSGDSRIDLVAWKEGEWAVVRAGGSDRTFRYCKGGPLRDAYGTQWSVQGDEGVLDLRIDGHTVTYQAYPDGMARLYGALFSQDIPVIVVNAAPGYEFLSECSPTHQGGGSHGSLHQRDSMIPLLIVGSAQRFPRPARLIDVKSFILQELAVAPVLA